MNMLGFWRAAALGAGIAICALRASGAEDNFLTLHRFVVDLKPGSDVNRVVRVLESQSIRVVHAVDMPDGPAVWVDIDPNNPPNIDVLRPLLPEVDAYAPDVPRQLLALASRFNDITIDGETLPWGVQAVQASQVPFGSTRKVCIIDSGYAKSHPDLPTFGVNGMDRGAGKWDGSDGGPLYMHGTHVAGTIAAVGGNHIGVVGVIPGQALDLFIVRVFDSNASFVYAGDLVLAMQDCADAGANIISMSLGGTYSNRAEERMVAKLTRQGILLVAAAGNGGNPTFSYPASYKHVLSVAAVDSNLQHASFSQYNTQVQIAAPGVRVLSTVPLGTARAPSLKVGSTVYAPRQLEGSPTATASAPLADFGLGDALNASIAGKVCLIQRGSITFADKVLNCQRSGGVGAVVYNNAPGSFDGTLGAAATAIPSVTASDVEGKSMTQQIGQVAQVTVRPGDYDFASGTSMATPHVSAVAALVWSHFPRCTGNHIREALRQSALTLAPSGRQDYMTGWGLVQTKSAFDYLAAQPCQGTGNQFD